ncbi:putative C6 transcription factor [Dactylonectria estremocensis]|uniref:C6 transcription factor n=1 Tax=Dactylonectria estremocensis TaxID=1079267 RepID=A0A9P9IUK6_9HYPO|nr:putative C6 transcription factor [Dactylonectria estremocensis]
MAPPKRPLPKPLPKNAFSSDGQDAYTGPSSSVDLPQKRRASAQAFRRIRQSGHANDAFRSIAAARLLLPTPSSTAVSIWRADAAEEPPTRDPHGIKKRRLMSPYDDSNFIFEKQYMVDARDRYVNDDIFIDISARTLPLSRWTTVSADDKLMNHLLNMFLTWDNIVERAIYRPMFQEDAVTMDPQSAHHQPGSFCTQVLVNALLAASCLYTLDPATFKYPENSTSRGRLWAEKAEALLAEIDKPSMTLLQGLYSLFVYKGNIGTGTKAVEYFQRRSTLAFGFRKLARRPKIVRAWRNKDFSLLQPDSVGYWWFAYPMFLQMQKSIQVEVREVDVLLSEIVEDALDFLHPEEGGLPPKASPNRALGFRLRFEETVLPSVILLQ